MIFCHWRSIGRHALSCSGMSGRVLHSAAVAHAIALFATSLVWYSLVGSDPAASQAQNLEAGKTPSQIFSSTCSLCHKSSRGILKSVAPGSLPGFLRQHYTTSSDMASAMSAFVMSNGATDARLGGDGLTQQGKDSHSAPKPSSTPASTEPERPAHRTREASKPDVERQDTSPSGKPEPKEKPEKPAADAKQKSASPKPPKAEPKAEPKSAAAGEEPESADQKPKDQSRPDAALQQASRSAAPNSLTRSDPVPAVTPAQNSAAEPVLTIDTSPAPQPLLQETSRPPAGPPMPPISE